MDLKLEFISKYLIFFSYKLFVNLIFRNNLYHIVNFILNNLLNI